VATCNRGFSRQENRDFEPVNSFYKQLFIRCEGILLSLKQRHFASLVMQRLASATFWSFIASMVTRASGLLASIIIARVLGKSVFGEFGIIQSTLDMFGTVAGFGLGLTSAKYVAECRSTDPAKAGRIIGISSVMSWFFGAAATLILIVLSPWIAEKAIAAPYLTSLLQVSAFSLLLGSINGAQMGALTGFEAFRLIARVSLISGVLTMVLRVAGTILFGLPGAIYGMVLAQVAACMVTYAALRKEAAKMSLSIGYKNCLMESAILWKFSLPSTLSSLTFMPVSWICNAMLVNQSSGFAEMGIFTAANQWYTMVTFFPGVMAQAAMPILCDRLNRGDDQQSKMILMVLVKTSALVLMPVMIAGAFSKIIMGFYGTGFATGWPTMLVSVVTAGLVGVQTPVAYMLAAKGKMWIWFIMSLGMGCIFIGMNALLVHHGALGMAWARFVAVVIHCAWSFTYLFYDLRKSPASVALK